MAPRYRPIRKNESGLPFSRDQGSASSVGYGGGADGKATLSPTLSSLSTAGARVGYALENRLFFATGGFDVTNEKAADELSPNCLGTGTDTGK